MAFIFLVKLINFELWAPFWDVNISSRNSNIRAFETGGPWLVIVL